MNVYSWLVLFPSYFTKFSLVKTKKIIYPSELFFFLYVSLNFPYVARLCASNLAKYIKKITSSFGVDYFLPLPLNTVSIRVKFGSSKEKITTRRMYIYLIPDTNILKCV